MRILCLGNNTRDTDDRTTQIAYSNSSVNHGLINKLDSLIIDGFYHTSIYDLTAGEIIKLSEKFDKVIVLGQPKADWSHPDAYLNTIDLKNKIKNLEFESDIDFDINYWQDLVNNNKSFCIFPFIELLVQNGVTTVCCRSDKEVTKLDKIEDFNTSNEYQDIRKNLLAGNKIDHCQSCYDLEKQGMLSARQQETIEWANRLNLNSVDDLNSFDGPVYYEVRASNNCNLQCRICSPRFSKLIEKEYNEIGLHSANISYQYTNFDFVNINKVKKLYVSGGEPTAMPEFYEFLRKCIKDKTTNFEMLVNTNGYKVSKTLLQLGKEFSNLHYIVSIDGFELANDYSRWPSKWNTLISNIKKIKDNGHKVTFNVSVSIYTIFSFAKLIKFLEGNFPDSSIHGQLVIGKLYPFIFKYNKKTINDLTTVTNTNIYQSDNLFKSFVDTLINLSKTSVTDQVKIQKFFTFNDLLDNSRSVKLVNYIPELEDLRNERRH